MLGLSVFLVPTGPIQAQPKEPDKEKRAVEIHQEIAELNGKIAKLEAELAKLQAGIVVHVAEELIPRQAPRADDWPMLGCDASNSFCNRHEKTLAPPLEKVWDCTLPGQLDGVVVSSGIVLAGGDAEKDQKHKVFAVDAQDGRHLWTFTLPGGGAGSIGMSPACLGDLAFFGGQNDKNVYAVHLRTGELRWQHGEIESMYDASPKVAEGVLYINSNQSGLWAFDAQTGKEKWRDKGPGWQADIAIKGGKLLRPGGAYGGGLVAFDAGTGAQRWRHTDGSTSFRMVATDDWLFVTYAGESPVQVTEGKDFKRFKYDRIAAFSTRDGKKAWETVLKEDAYHGGLLLAGDCLYAATPGGSIYCLDAKTGKIRKERTFKEGWGRLIAASNLIFASDKGGISALAPDTLETLWSTSLPGFQYPAVANGRLYVAAGSRIVAFANGKK
jgi:outer membrane protein assembly factor BamB